MKIYLIGMALFGVYMVLMIFSPRATRANNFMKKDFDDKPWLTVLACLVVLAIWPLSVLRITVRNLYK